jgi:hypothetical protein
LPRAVAEAAETATPEATEAATTAPRQMHGYGASREAAMAAFAKSWGGDPWPDNKEPQLYGSTTICL